MSARLKFFTGMAKRTTLAEPSGVRSPLHHQIVPPLNAAVVSAVSRRLGGCPMAQILFCHRGKPSGAQHSTVSWSRSPSPPTVPDRCLYPPGCRLHWKLPQFPCLPLLEVTDDNILYDDSSMLWDYMTKTLKVSRTYWSNVNIKEIKCERILAWPNFHLNCTALFILSDTLRASMGHSLMWNGKLWTSRFTYREIWQHNENNKHKTTNVWYYGHDGLLQVLNRTQAFRYYKKPK